MLSTTISSCLPFVEAMEKLAYVALIACSGKPLTTMLDNELPWFSKVDFF
jgi:hypothetical protein